MSDAVTWKCVEFHALTPAELYSVLQLRQRVFVVEQKCAYLDADGIDSACLHLMGWANTASSEEISSRTRALVAYARLIPPGVKFPKASIGRVATHPAWRGIGLGKELMAQAMDQARKQGWNHQLMIQAQSYLEPFYEGFGFQRVSEPYVEDGIRHVDMIVE